MLFIENEAILKKEKIRFFNLHLDFIHHYMPDIIKDYVSAYTDNGVTSSLNVRNIDLQMPDLTVVEQRLFYCIIYVCCREIDTYWEDFFECIQSLSTPLAIDFSSEFLFDNTRFKPSDLYTIRQCRVDKPLYTDTANINVGFYNKNENFSYNCYDNQMAQAYIVNNCSLQALAAYNNIRYPQAKSDFFLMASLYTDGGISADVCSVAQSNLEILIKDTEFLLIYDEKGIHKKFIFA